MVVRAKPGIDNRFCANFELNPALDLNALAATYARDGRVRVHNFLSNRSALAFATYLLARSDWSQIINSGDRVYDLNRSVRQEMDVDRFKSLDSAVYRGAREGFQHRYEAIRVSDEEVDGAADMDLLVAWAQWLSYGDGIALLRAVTGQPAIGFADAQATLYSPGDFLTAHNDAVVGKGRVAAYVLGLTATWRTEWGGLLLFHEQDGRVVGETPGFNTLDLFSVPMLHSVSLVSPAASCSRLSVTGWARLRDDQR